MRRSHVKLRSKDITPHRRPSLSCSSFTLLNDRVSKRGYF